MSSAVRIRTALVLLPAFLAILFFGGVVVFAAMIAVIAAIGSREYQELVSPHVKGSETWFVPLWSAAIVLAFLGPQGSPAVGAVFALGCLVYLGVWLLGAGPSPDTLQRWGAALGAWVFVGYFLGHGVAIRAHGTGAILFLAVIVWAGDSAAFFIGSAFGRRRLAPKVSPKKSVEGALASVAASALAAALVGLAIPLPHTLPVSVGLGVLLNVAAQIGDLAESLFKRCAGVKDSGTLFPGHGGVLDRLDGFLLAVPLYAHFLRFGGG